MPDIQFQYRLVYKKTVIIYNVNPQHRVRGNPNKSIWIVAPDVEFACFKYTFENQWVDGNDAWGFLRDENKKMVLLGSGQNNEELKLAKFKKYPTADEWHGYPCNYLTKSQDVPTDKVLRDWVEKRYISKAKMNKIQHQLVCVL